MTGSGRIKTSLPLDDEIVTKKTLHGRFGDGGRDIVVRTRSGGITIA